MDVYDAGVYCYRWSAPVPKGLKVVLWGPIQAKELGLSEWSYQDGGETGFVYHSQPRSVGLGSATASLLAVRRLSRAFLTIYLAGYPTDAPGAQRRLDVQGIVTEAEVFLSRLAGLPVRFDLDQEVALVDHAGIPAPTENAAAPSSLVFDV